MFASSGCQFGWKMCVTCFKQTNTLISDGWIDRQEDTQKNRQTDFHQKCDSYVQYADTDNIRTVEAGISLGSHTHSKLCSQTVLSPYCYYIRHMVMIQKKIVLTTQHHVIYFTCILSSFSQLNLHSYRQNSYQRWLTFP